MESTMEMTAIESHSRHQKERKKALEKILKRTIENNRDLLEELAKL